MSAELVKRSGWMTKQGGVVKNWKKRWFVLRGKELAYYEKPDKKESGVIDLTKAKEITTAPETKKKCALKIVTSGRTYYCYTDTQNDCDSWIKDLNLAIGIEISKKSLVSSQPTSQKPSSQNKTFHNDDNNKFTLDDFTLIRVLGRGSYGKVQLVRCKRDQKLYAMKTMSKKLLEETDQVEQTIIERDILFSMHHPFLVSAYCCFQTDKKVFMILDYINGGELFGRLQEEGAFNETRARLYAAEIALAIGQLHKLGFIYRDLKPENILIDRDGHLRITDFGLVKAKMTDKSTTTTFCGTPEYIAPEIITNKPYTKDADWWSYGVLVYEMLNGIPPFYDENTNKMYRMIISEKITFPSHFSDEAVSFLSQLLERDPTRRLGTGPGDIEDIKAHPWFAPLNWNKVLNKEVQPEWVPDIKNEIDTSNFDETFTNEKVQISVEPDSVLSKETQKCFVGFTSKNESHLD
ncbi:AGC family protein kinase [Tritrichomonas foetus]|uniref:non-specific serine/threonine protein kinase n=1 Tax=Tritrichomonas foetus TaxID=1144522 RepID=A0A1J4KST9_9EUKA|nr:AGC family protein kinase [Tritrichomonas foetus]|eukprot:OHT14359.1 AGC family protein kinase [Tritrichomonas foetus]